LIPLECLPGFGNWGRSLDALLARPEPLWVFGETGCGASTVAAELARRRGVAFLDEADRAEDLAGWLRLHPRGILAAHAGLPEAAVGSCVEFRIPSLEEDPAAMADCLARLAEEEGVPGPLPPSLGLLPCPGNLRGLRNRVVRWKLLGQLPEDTLSPAGVLPTDSDDMAMNLHFLERLLLHRALRRSYGNRVEAAQRLGVSRRQLYLLIARHGDPVRGEAPTSAGPKRLGRAKMRQNSSPDSGHR